MKWNEAKCSHVTAQGIHFIITWRAASSQKQFQNSRNVVFLASERPVVFFALYCIVLFRKHGLAGAWSSIREIRCHWCRRGLITSEKWLTKLTNKRPVACYDLVESKNAGQRPGRLDANKTEAIGAPNLNRPFCLDRLISKKRALDYFTAAQTPSKKIPSWRVCVLYLKRIPRTRASKKQIGSTTDQTHRQLPRSARERIKSFVFSSLYFFFFSQAAPDHLQSSSTHNNGTFEEGARRCLQRASARVWNDSQHLDGASLKASLLTFFYLSFFFFELPISRSFHVGFDKEREKITKTNAFFPQFLKWTPFHFVSAGGEKEEERLRLVGSDVRARHVHAVRKK